jgi:hypothetical protein
VLGSQSIHHSRPEWQVCYGKRTSRVDSSRALHPFVLLERRFAFLWQKPTTPTQSIFLLPSDTYRWLNNNLEVATSV